MRGYGSAVQRFRRDVIVSGQATAIPNDIRLVGCAPFSELTLDDLPEDAGVKPHGIPGGASAATGPDHLVGRPLEEVERYYTEKALELTCGNREEAAKMLGIAERTLYRKLQEWKKEAERKGD